MFRLALAAARPGRQALSAQLSRPSVRFFADKRGVVKFFNPERGFGFINSENEDFFVHYTGITSSGGFKSLGDGEEVEFDLEVDSSGKQRAVRVTGPGGAPVKGSQRQRTEAGDGMGERY
mmetsp:Transcript_68857/g.201627  ORF Transcript_68857/g.201627 Transcript_68857/m.201627 type:complete len:120 (-) Transcript_68857:44-403(-)